MHRSQPFARAMTMMAAISAAMGLDSIARQSAMSNIGPYKSRGKGRGTPERRYLKSRSKYQPHIGAKESAKFVARMAATQAQFLKLAA